MRKSLSVFLIIFFTVPFETTAEELWDYAKKWEDQNVIKKNSMKNDEMKENGQLNAAEKASDAKSTVKKPASKKVVKQKKQANVKKVPLDIIRKAASPKVLEVTQVSLPVVTPSEKNHRSLRDDDLSEDVVMHKAASMGGFFKRMLNIMGIQQDEKLLRQSLLAARSDHQAASSNLHKVMEKNKRLQELLNVLQKKLKQEQFPDIPTISEDREDFASGIAAGHHINELLDSHESIGVKINRNAFYAGVKEGFQDNKRLTSEEIQQLLESTNTRISLAVLSMEKKREANDRQWIKLFSRDKNTRSTKDAVKYQIVYAGDEKIEDKDTISISILRRTSNGVIIDDTDLDGSVIKYRFNEIPTALKGVLMNIGMHGEVKVAMPVNGDGKPQIDGRFMEEWTVRITNFVES